jgi:hypothetical protein
VAFKGRMIDLPRPSLALDATALRGQLRIVST